MINIAQETLGFRRTDFSSVLSLLMPAESLLFRPAVLTVNLQPMTECSPTTLPCGRIRSFGNMLEPRYIFNALPQPFPLSIYLGTLAGGLGSFPFDHES